MIQSDDSPSNNVASTSVELNAALPQELRHYLQKRLPEYMVPSIFVILDALPVTPTGKLDYRALPVPDQKSGRPMLDKEYVAPRTPVEELLAGIWAEVLKLEWVGIHDNFFDLGGHSLLTIQITSRIEETFQLELPLLTIFEFPTVAEFATIIELRHRIKERERQREEQALQNGGLPLSMICTVILIVIAGLIVGWAAVTGRISTYAVAWNSAFSAFQDFELIVAVMLVVLIAFEIWFLIQTVAHLGRIRMRLESLEEHGVRLADDSWHGLEEEEDAPNFELPNIYTGETVSLRDLLAQDPESTRPIVLIFSSPHCNSCDAMIPDYMQWLKRYGNRVTIAMITEGTPQENRARFADYDEKPLVLLQKGKQVSDAYKVRSTPTAVSILFDGSIDETVDGQENIKFLLLALAVCWPYEQYLRRG